MNDHAGGLGPLYIIKLHTRGTWQASTIMLAIFCHQPPHHHEMRSFGVVVDDKFVQGRMLLLTPSSGRYFALK